MTRALKAAGAQPTAALSGDDGVQAARLPSAQRRRQLVEAAIRAMTRDGVANTTTRSIVAEADVSLSVFHYCFESKHAMLEAVIETILEQSVSEAMSAMSAITPRRTLEGTIRAGLQAYWDNVVARPDEHLLTYELTQYALRQPGFETVARRQYTAYEHAIQDFVARLGETIGLELTAPVDVLARYVVVVLDGLTLNFLALGDSRSAEAVLDTVTAHLLTMVHVHER